MEKLPPPLLGFNNNVRHQGRVFHIQTEDSGVRHARIVTHLFADGGRILRTTRTDYSDKLGHKDMAESLRQVMKEQHKAMFIALRAGELDDTINGVFASTPPGAAELPPTLGADTAAADTQSGAASDPDSADVSDADATQRLAPIQSDANPAPVGASASTERAAVESEAVSATQDSGAFPPSEPPSVGARPAPVFDVLHKPELSIFGEGVLSEKSLDDVILSYLAEDLEEPPPQK